MTELCNSLTETAVKWNDWLIIFSTFNSWLHTHGDTIFKKHNQTHNKWKWASCAFLHVERTTIFTGVLFYDDVEISVPKFLRARGAATEKIVCHQCCKKTTLFFIKWCNRSRCINHLHCLSTFCSDECTFVAYLFTAHVLFNPLVSCEVQCRHVNSMCI